MSEPPPVADGRADGVASHVALVGLMGSGKSLVGRLVADRLERELIDTDELVEHATGMTISDLFSSRGEDAFRRYELESLERALVRNEPSVIATGGGVVVTPDARRVLTRDATVVWLRATPACLAERLAGATDRPLLAGRDPIEVLTELSTRRDALYAEVSDAVVEVDGRDPEQVAADVLDVLGWAP